MRRLSLSALACWLLLMACTPALLKAPKSTVGPPRLAEDDYLLLKKQYETGNGVAYHLLHYEPLTGMMGMMLLGEEATSRGEWLKVVLETPYSMASTEVHNAKLNYTDVDWANIRESYGALDSCYVVTDFSGKEGADFGVVERLENREPNEGALTRKKEVVNIVVLVDGKATQASSHKALRYGGLRAGFPIEKFDCSAEAKAIKIAVIFVTEDGSQGRKEIEIKGSKLKSLK